MKSFKKAFFKTLAKFNKIVMPSISKKDINNLSKYDKLIVGYRYYITKNSLDD